MWEGLIQKAKDGGLDVIQTYVFWNGHEPTPGNVRKILHLCSSIPLSSLLTHTGFGWYFFASRSTISKRGTIWSGSWRRSRRPGCLYISASVPTFVASGTSGISPFPEIISVKWSITVSSFGAYGYMHAVLLSIDFYCDACNFVVASQFGWSMYQASASGQTTNLSRSVSEITSPTFLDLVGDTFSFVIIVMLLSVCADGNAGFHWENCGNDEERKPLCIPRWPNYPLSGKYNRFP